MFLILLLILLHSNTRGQRNLTKKAASLPHMDGSMVFARLCQCAPHLIHAALAHSSPQPERHLDQFSHFCTTHDSVIGHARACPFLWKLHLCMEQSRPHLNTWFLGPTWILNPNSTSVSSAIFYSSQQRVPILYKGPPFPSKLPLPMGGSGPPSNTWFLGQPESWTQTASRSVQPFLQGSLLWQTDRLTDHL